MLPEYPVIRAYRVVGLSCRAAHNSLPSTKALEISTTHKPQFWGAVAQHNLAISLLPHAFRFSKLNRAAVCQNLKD